MAHLNRIAFGAAILLLAGCASNAPQKMYTWEGYQDSVYHYYTNKTSQQEQISELQKLVEISRASNKPVPPGVHAQLGMLYSNTGNSGLAMAEFNAEKTLYPESASYINFLTAKK
ncbi:DUF4810 domain-containing protein [Trabulsiella odontotermitis]|uniref:Lipoprotein n=1 Tax=Trabulsiella odontotermitis TaxID=379893 RepID=A0A0L0GJC0_9ENTR|nr:DUF4810 domain-containing protein [Trabulsiella odontotermitis]KNC88428.1 hypothetical protein GM31_10790 [Trabulsiella odontotermitis]KNC92047.1 hypothetical protein GM30_19630 [Trabulsiella odontotermitis]